MRTLSRSLLPLALGALLGTASLAGQDGSSGTFQWFVGAHGGVTIYETDAQTQGGIPMGGGHMLITAKRTGLLLSVEEGFGSDERAAYADPTAPAGIQQVAFNDIRKYSAVIIGYPFRSNVTPFFGVGFGFMHVHNAFPLAAANPEEAFAITEDRGSFGFGTFVGGLQFRVGGVAAFGMYQITTRPGGEKLITGPTHTFSGGLRFSLGGSREGTRAGH